MADPGGRGVPVADGAGITRTGEVAQSHLGGGPIERYRPRRSMVVGGVGGHMVFHRSRLRTTAVALLPLVPSTLIFGLNLAERLAVPALLLCVLLVVVIAERLATSVIAGALAIISLNASLLWHDLTPREYMAHWSENVAVVAVVAAIVLAGCPVRLLASERMASERRHAALTYQLELLAPVLEDSPVGLAIFGTDLRCRYVNRALQRLHGRDFEHFIGRSAAEIMPRHGLEYQVAAISEVVKKGVAEFGSAQQMWVGDECLQVVIARYPVRGPGGDVTGAAIAFVDLTVARKLAEMEAESAQLRKLTDLTFRCKAAQRVAGLSTWEVDLVSGRRSCSESLLVMLGTDQETFADADITGYVHPGDRQRLVTSLKRLVASESKVDSTVQLEIRTVLPNGRLTRVLVVAEVTRDETGRPVRLWGTVQDITDRLAAEAAHREAVAAADRARAELALERSALHIVQRAMLPSEVPAMADVDLAFKYQPVEEVGDVGGDWYDAFVLPDGRLGVAVGDVTGHDVRAATVMGNVRNAVRAYAVEDPRPGMVLSRTNALLRALSDRDNVTAAFGIYDPAAGRLTFARAGHPPPLVRFGGCTEVLFEPSGAVLGETSMRRPYPEVSVVLERGDAVLFYTDGLVERRDLDSARSTQRLREVVNGIPRQTTAADIVTVVAAAMIDPAPAENDVCLLVLRRP